MKKTLLIMLLLTASAITAHAQGFRVYRSDGSVYQFSWVADSIAFYEGEGDPNYVEPIPDEVRRAIEELQTYVANNAAMIARLNDMVISNTAEINDVKHDILGDVTTYITLLRQQIADLQAEVNTNSTNIYDTIDRIYDIQNRVVTIQDALSTLQGKLMELQEKEDEQDEGIDDLMEQFNRIQEECVAMNDNIQNIKVSLMDLQARVTQNERAIADINQVVNLNRTDIQELKERNIELKTQVESDEEVIRVLFNSDEEKQDQIEALNDVIQDLLDRVAVLESRVQ